MPQFSSASSSGGTFSNPPMDAFNAVVAEKYRASAADTDEKAKKARRTLRNGDSTSSRSRCFDV